MSAPKRPSPPSRPTLSPMSRASDGFATLTGDMMERHGATPPPLVDPSVESNETGVSIEKPQPLFGKRRNEGDVQPTRIVRSGLGTLGQSFTRENLSVSDQVGEGSIPKDYSGVNRRKRDVSPVIERRRSVPARVKVSVRLEQHRHQRLKGAGVLLDRTHQDIITVALDQYLDVLGVLKGETR